MVALPFGGVGKSVASQYNLCQIKYWNNIAIILSTLSTFKVTVEWVPTMAAIALIPSLTRNHACKEAHGLSVLPICAIHPMRIAICL